MSTQWDITNLCSLVCSVQVSPAAVSSVQAVLTECWCRSVAHFKVQLQLQAALPGSAPPSNSGSGMRMTSPDISFSFVIFRGRPSSCLPPPPHWPPAALQHCSTSSVVITTLLGPLLAPPPLQSSTNFTVIYTPHSSYITSTTISYSFFFSSSYMFRPVQC